MSSRVSMWSAIGAAGNSMRGRSCAALPAARSRAAKATRWATLKSQLPTDSRFLIALALRTRTRNVAWSPRKLGYEDLQLVRLSGRDGDFGSPIPVQLCFLAVKPGHRETSVLVDMGRPLPAFGGAIGTSHSNRCCHVCLRVMHFL